MKIVFLARLFYPHIGGVEKHAMEVSKILIKRGHEISVITEKFDSSLPKQEIINNIKIYRINTGGGNWFKKFLVWKEMLRLKNIIEAADIVHCHDVFFWYLLFRFLYPHKPVYTTFHGYESFPIRKRAIVMRKITELLSWGNICIGDFIKKWYRTKATFVSYGATEIRSKKQEAGIKVKKDSAVFIGRLDEQTGILAYSKAVEYLKKKYREFSFTIIGDGKYKSMLIRKNKVLGFQKDPEKYFAKYHFAFVSRYLSILEAMAARKLVFAVYDNSVKEDYLKMAPFAQWIVIEKNPEKLAEKIHYFLENPEEEKKIIESGYQWVKHQTWEALTSEYLSLWKLKNK